MKKFLFISLRFFLVLSTFVVTLQGHGQAYSTHQNNSFHLAFAATFEGTWFNNKALNDAFAAENLPTSFNKISFGVNSDFYLSSLSPATRFLADIGAGLATQSSTRSDIKCYATELSNDYNIDYVAWKHNRNYLFPGLGIGWASYLFSFMDQKNMPSTLPAALQDFSGERTIRSGNLFYLNLAGNYAWSLDKSGDLLLGIKASFHLGLNHKDLELGDGTGLSDSPTLNATAFFVGATLMIQ